ncbi:BAI1-associated protein 3-like Protein [Tribolium castaneum]|uniref:BAI1-associated protein 3-like Protein n=1 Tax=Tribolium castaneum TaxID=7070 RepID=D6X3H8_TRICA|nr:BAI1-associated protein 3-like Protein [Tribolium castaneum]
MLCFRIQQVDGGFFEKFGNLLREHAETTENRESEEKRKVEQIAECLRSDECASTDTEFVASSGDSDNEAKSLSSDSEDEKDKTDLISAAFNFSLNGNVPRAKPRNNFRGVKKDELRRQTSMYLASMTIDELYAEILYEILHNVGCDVSVEIGQTALISYAQDAFKIPNNKHNQLLSEAEKKEAPEFLINVEVIEAKDLKPKDSNGLSDPFVTLYLASNTSHRYNTSVKYGTLVPTWEEHFALPISDNSIDDTLCIEVWDFDPAESVKEKFGRFFDVKGVKGMRKFVKEIAVAAATGQHENELIGVAKIPLNSIPASGLTMWYSLDKKNKATRQGVIKIRIAFSAEKNRQVAAQEHRHMLRIILLHELELSKVAQFWWCGTFSPQGEALLTQHIAQSGLTPPEVALCQWSVYTSVHQNHQLSFSLFSKLLEKLAKPLRSEEDLKIFWDGAKKLLPSCFSVIRKIRKRDFKDKMTMQQLTEVLNILGNIKMMEMPADVDLFPNNMYPWVTFSEDTKRDILTVVADAVQQGADDWFNHITENNVQQVENDVGRLQYLIQAIQLVKSDLQKALEFYDKLFQQTINFQYAKALYVFYQAKISALAEPDVRNICKSLKKLSFTGFTTNETDSNEPLKEGTTLFELYLALHRFVVLGKGLCQTDSDSFHIRNFYQWFHGGVAQWLDIAVFKALQRIEKAVELDKLVPVDTTVRYSSSAVDTISIFYQVKVFWQQLNWPDVEGCYTFIAKIIDDICRCCVFYAERMAMRVDGMGVQTDEKKFEVTNEWCLAINNIEYVRQSLQPFTDELGMEGVIEKLADLKSAMEAKRCQDTLNTVIANAIDTVKNEIIALLETVVKKMVPAMKRLLIEGAELFNQDSNSIDRLMLYVDSNLSTLHNELNEENFNRVLEIVWDNLDGILKEIIQSNLEKRRPPSFFANLHKTLNLMLGSFKANDLNCEELKKTELKLKVNGLETNDLIHLVHLNLYEEFKNLKESKYGVLSVKAKFENNNNLKVTVMNARNLLAMDSNGYSDSFVRIHLLPEHKFSGIPKPKTQTHYKTLFPLYDENFTVELPTDYKSVEDGLLLFSVKDKDMLGYNNQYIGEAFLHFKDIDSSNTPMDDLPQISLALGRPTDLSTEAIKALESRLGDKQAKEFLRKLKQRMGTS